MVSGGFDPLHAGHVELIENAAKLGRVVVALNSDEWLYRKKGYFFMDWPARAKILRGLRAVAAVVPVDDADGTVSQALEAIQPQVFANGGDRITANKKEDAICQKLGIAQVFGVGGEKIESSSALVARCYQRINA